MAPSTSSLLAGIPASHLAGLAAGVVALALALVPRRVRRRLDALDVLLLFTGALHLGLAVGHSSIDGVLSVLFVLDGLAFGAAVLLRRSTWWWRCGTGLLLLGTVLAYLVYVGAGREAPDPVGVLDKLVELVALGLVMQPHRGSARGWRRQVRWVIASVSTLGLTFAVTAAMFVEGLTGAAQAHGAAASCLANHDPGFGAVLRPTPCSVTPAQQAAADELVSETRAGIAQYSDVRVALRAGYRPSQPDGSGAVHYTRFGGASYPVLDPQHPAALVYVRTRTGELLLGAMYQMPQQGQPGPDIGGALTPWHYHTNVCVLLPGLLIAGLSTPYGECPPGAIRVTSADQLHVWTAPNPNGPFGDLDEAWVKRLEGS